MCPSIVSPQARRGLRVLGFGCVAGPTCWPCCRLQEIGRKREPGVALSCTSPRLASRPRHTGTARRARTGVESAGKGKIFRLLDFPPDSSAIKPYNVVSWRLLTRWRDPRPSAGRPFVPPNSPPGRPTLAFPSWFVSSCLPSHRHNDSDLIPTNPAGRNIAPRRG